MRHITFRYSFFLVFIILIQIECVLQFAGWLLGCYQDHLNNRFTSKNVIVTLGESTTSDAIDPYVISWPRQLETLLQNDQNSPKIMNLAIPGTDSLRQYDLFISHFEKDTPQLIITMMGINDSPFFWPRASHLTRSSFFYKIKLVRIFLWLTSAPLQQQTPPSPQVNHNRNFPEVNDLLMKIKSSKRIPEEDILALVQRKTSLDRSHLYMHMATELMPPWGEKDEKFLISYDFYKRSLKESLGIKDAAEIFTLLARKINKADCIWLAEKFLTSMKSPTTILISRMANCLPENHAVTKEFFDTFAKNFSLDFSSTSAPTLNTYQLLYEWAKSRKICIVAMTYASNSDYDLYELLKPLSSEMFIVINNDPLFTNALKELKYHDLFTDNFAQSFGHATTKGNTLIAKNAFELLRQLSAEKRCGVEKWLKTY